MSNFPDFSHHNFQIEKELGHNRAGGRITYLALNTQTHQKVVIKQFQFAKADSTWSDFDAYGREVQLLKEVNHPGIPRYLDSFQTIDGFCMVQEYKQAASLAVSRSFNPDDIMQIAIAALEVLVYLQSRIPPIIHRDIKPENILVDEVGNVYLVDFGFARVGEGEVGVSSVVKGTLGFMPPEQIFNRQLTEASDLYGLGMTLICLLTGTQSDRIGDLVDISYRVSFRHLVTKLNAQWVNWLEKMVEPRLKDRFPNAVAALAAIPAAPIRPPEAHFSQTCLRFDPSRTSKLLSQPIVITNPIPDTTLEGRWEIVTHATDPDPTIYQWIAVTPETFAANRVTCQVSIDSSRLMAGKTYHRKLRLHTNTLEKTYFVNLQIYSASSPVQVDLFPYSILSLLCLFTLSIGWLIGWSILIVGTVAESSTATGISAVAGVAMGLEIAAWIMRSSGWRNGSTTSTMLAVILVIAVLIKAVSGNITNAGPVIIVGVVTGLMGGATVGIGLGTVVENLIARSSPRGLTIAVTSLIVTLGASLGLSLTIGFNNSLLLTLLISSTLGLLGVVLHINLKHLGNLFTQYKSERYLIKP